MTPASNFSGWRVSSSQPKNNGTKVIIAGHIPPGIDAYYEEPLWFDTYLQQFQDILSSYADVIEGLFFGHIHRDEFRIFQADLGETLLIGSSVTPIYDNNPSFKTVYFNQSSFALLNFQQFSMDLELSNENAMTDWSLDYDYSQLYMAPDLSPSSVELVINSMDSNNVVFNEFYAVRDGLYESEKFIVVCSLNTQSYSQYQSCLSSHKYSKTPPQ